MLVTTGALAEPIPSGPTLFCKSSQSFGKPGRPTSCDAVIWRKLSLGTQSADGTQEVGFGCPHGRAARSESHRSCQRILDRTRTLVDRRCPPSDRPIRQTFAPGRAVAQPHSSVTPEPALAPQPAKSLNRGLLRFASDCKLVRSARHNPLAARVNDLPVRPSTSGRPGKLRGVSFPLVVRPLDD